jgi:hypothetical protein
MSLQSAIMSAYKKEERAAHVKCIASLKDQLEYENELIDGVETPFGDILTAKGDDYTQLLQDVCDWLLIEYGWETLMTLKKHSSSVGMSTLGLCKPYISSKYRAGKRNLLPLMRRGKRDLGPNVALKYSQNQLIMNKRELDALLRGIGEL